MRLFIGIPVSGDYVRIMRRIQDTWRPRLASRVSWTRPELAHVTLGFLGEVDKDRVPAIGDAMRAAVGKGFVAQGGSGGVFPRSGAPRVVWIDLAQGSSQCREICTRLDPALVRFGFAPESRPFVAHVTMARVKVAAGRDDWPGLLRDLGGVWPQWTVDRIVLWQSVLAASGPRYTIVDEVMLGDGDHGRKIGIDSEIAFP